MMPVRVTVLDAETDWPIDEFSYSYCIQTPGRYVAHPIWGAKTGLPAEWRSVASPEGTLLIDAPRSCRILLGIRARDYLSGHGYPGHQSYLIRDRDLQRQLVVKLKPAATVLGRVKDEESGKPVAEARICPVVFAPPGSMEDGSRAIESDERGSFELHGVDPFWGVSISHDDYLQAGAELRSKDINIDDDGRFVIEVFLKRAGTIREIGIPASSHRVMGRVLGENGETIRSFSMSAGLGPEPDDCESTFAGITDDEGRFDITVRESGRIWLGVKAPGHAVWEASLENEQAREPMTVRLERGTFLQGLVSAPARRRGPLNVRLVPELLVGDSLDHEAGLELSSRQSFGMLETTVHDNGAFRVEHVRPGRYRLHVFGPGLTPIHQLVEVLHEGRDVGRLALQGTGSIFGRVSSPRAAEEDTWPFAELVVWFSDFPDTMGQEHLRPIGYRADENGQFRIDGVPVGSVRVLVPYDLSADSSDAYVRHVRVLEDRATEVRFFDPERSWDVPFEFIVGDGSEAHWLSGAAMDNKQRARDGAPASLPIKYEFSPVNADPVSFIGPERDSLVQQGIVVAPDIHPGKYRVRFECHGLLDPIYDDIIDVTPQSDVVDIRLPAGSITGRIEGGHRGVKGARVFAVSNNAHPCVRRASCDSFADFFLTFLPADDYKVYAWHPEQGYGRFGPISIANTTVDIGERRLAPGGTIEGTVTRITSSAEKHALYVTHTTGVAICVEDSVDPDKHEFVIRHLWPGDWVLTLRLGERTVASAKAFIEGTETVHAHLTCE